MAEDGTILAGHVSSSESWAKIDLTSGSKRHLYEAHYPNGYRLEWVDYDDIADDKLPDGLKKAFELADGRKA